MNKQEMECLRVVIDHLRSDEATPATSISQVSEHLVVLSEYLDTAHDYISRRWHVDDVRCRRPDLSLEQCREVLNSLDRYHDAETGINWYTIDYCANKYYPEPDNVQELRRTYDGADGPDNVYSNDEPELTLERS